MQHRVAAARLAHPLGGLGLGHPIGGKQAGDHPGVGDQHRLPLALGHDVLHQRLKARHTRCRNTRPLSPSAGRALPPSSIHWRNRGSFCSSWAGFALPLAKVALGHLQDDLGVRFGVEDAQGVHARVEGLA